MNKKIITRFVYPITILILLTNCVFHIINCARNIESYKSEFSVSFTSNYFSIAFSIILNIIFVIAISLLLYYLSKTKTHTKSSHIRLILFIFVLVISFVFAYNLTNYISQLQAYDLSINNYTIFLKSEENNTLILFYKELITNYQNLKLSIILLLISSSITYLVLIINILIVRFYEKFHKK